MTQYVVWTTRLNPWRWLQCCILCTNGCLLWVCQGEIRLTVKHQNNMYVTDRVTNRPTRFLLFHVTHYHLI